MVASALLARTSSIMLLPVHNPTCFPALTRTDRLLLPDTNVLLHHAPLLRRWVELVGRGGTARLLVPQVGAGVLAWGRVTNRLHTATMSAEMDGKTHVPMLADSLNGQ